jgi:hypothetical protein
MEFLFLFVFFSFDFTGKYSRSRLLELLYPSVNLGLAHSKFRTQFNNALSAGQSSEGDLGLERRGMIYSLGHDWSPFVAV